MVLSRREMERRRRRYREACPDDGLVVGHLGTMSAQSRQATCNQTLLSSRMPLYNEDPSYFWADNVKRGTKCP
jgi:hypothetical protein